MSAKPEVPRQEERSPRQTSIPPTFQTDRKVIRSNVAASSQRTAPCMSSRFVWVECVR